MSGSAQPDPLPEDEDAWIPLDVLVNAVRDALAEDFPSHPLTEAAESSQ